MVRENEQYAYFTLTGEFDPAAVTARLGVEPTRAWRKGDACERTHLERRFSWWSLYSRLARDVDLEEHVGDVLTQLDAAPEAFAAASREFGGTMQLVGYFYRYYPGFSLKAHAVEGLGRYTLALDCDFYYFYSPEREDTSSDQPRRDVPLVRGRCTTRLPQVRDA